jgi:hypothetical protein
MTMRRNDAIRRHFRHFAAMAATCRYADAPSWAEYLAWIDNVSADWSSLPKVTLLGADSDTEVITCRIPAPIPTSATGIG